MSLKGFGLPVLCIAAVLAFAGVAGAQQAGYMLIIGSHGSIQGESTAQGHQGWIFFRDASAPSVSEITALQNERSVAVQSPRDPMSGAPSGKRQHGPVTIIKEIDKSSPRLSEACASGQHFKEVDIAFVRQEKGHEIVGPTYKLTDAIITAVERVKVSSGGDRPRESVTFDYAKIEIIR
jgi:type VI secretion system secreted protein Hcp